MAIKLSGEWMLSVASKSAAYDQRIIIAGSSNDQDGVYDWDDFGTKTVQGSFGVQIQYQKSGEWYNSLMRVPDVVRSGNDVTLTIESDDKVGAGDLDFNDLVLTAETTVDDDDYCVWGQVQKYSGCLFNPCELPILVIDDYLYMAQRLPARLRDLIEPLPELPPTIKPPLPDPPPWEHRAIRVEVPPELLQELVSSRADRLRRGAFRAPGAMTLSDVQAEALEVSKMASSAAISASSAYGLLVNRLGPWIKCHTSPADGVILRMIDYDPGPGESPDGPYYGTGSREVLGQVVTDDWGFYFFCFHWTYPHVGGLKPDIMLQLVRYNEEGAPFVALESSVSWNIDKLFRKDWCIPSHLADPTTPDVVDPGRMWQYIGNLPVVRISTAAKAAVGKGLATSVPGDGTATYPLNLVNAPFGGTLLLKASFNNLPQVAYYRIRYRTTDNPAGNTPWTDLATPLQYYDATWTLQTVGPVPAMIEGMMRNAYPNLEGQVNYSHPHGLQYKGYINTGFVDTGFLHLRIYGYDSNGDFVPGSFDTVTLRIDNVAPLVEISPITAGAGACGFVTIDDPDDKIPVTYRVIDGEGHLRHYHFNLWKCHDTLIGDVQQYRTNYDAGSMGIFWTGTPDELALGPDLDGFVTRKLPQTGDFFTSGEAAIRPNFAAVAIELWASSRTTNGIRSSIHHPRYIEVIGVKLE